MEEEHVIWRGLVYTRRSNCHCNGLRIIEELAKEAGAAGERLGETTCFLGEGWHEALGLRGRRGGVGVEYHNISANFNMKRTVVNVLK